MIEADEFQEVLSGLFFWQAYDPSVRTDLSSVAVVAEGELVFVDPIPLKRKELAKLLTGMHPSAIVLTNGNHARAAESFRDELKIPILSHQAASTELQIEVDDFLQEGSLKLAGLEVIELPGFGAGEIALHGRSGRGLMLMGDALINVESHGFVPLPEKYCANPKQSKASLGKLLKFSFEALTFAHGLPITAGAHRRLKQILT